MASPASDMSTRQNLLDRIRAISNSYWLSENLPNAVLFTYSDAGHGSLFEGHDSFTRQKAAFFASNSPHAPR